MKNAKIIPWVAILLSLGAGAAMGYYGWTTYHNSQQVVAKEWTTYQRDELSIAYPSNWHIRPDTTSDTIEVRFLAKEPSENDIKPDITDRITVTIDPRDPSNKNTDLKKYIQQELTNETIPPSETSVAPAIIHGATWYKVITTDATVASFKLVFYETLYKNLVISILHIQRTGEIDRYSSIAETMVRSVVLKP